MNKISMLISYPHEFCHYIVAKLFKFKIDEVCYYRESTDENKAGGYVRIIIPEEITKIFLLKYALVTIAPLILTFILCIPLFFIDYYSLNDIDKGFYFFYVIYILLLCYCGYFPSNPDWKSFYESLVSIYHGEIIISDENNNEIITKIK